MNSPDPVLLKAAESILLSCPIKFSFDLAFVPSKKIQMKEGGGYKDTSFVGIIIYEDDINRYSEPDRVLIGSYLNSARNLLLSQKIPCQFLPLTGKREDHDLASGIPIG